MKTANYLVKKLEELGVNEFFGVPGDYNFKLLHAVQNNPNTNWKGCTNELNAGYAADGYARLKGYGAIITTYGVGELSCINAVAGAMAENVPLVCIVGMPDSKSIQHKTRLHHNFQDVNYFNYLNAFKNVTSATAFLAKDNAKEEIDRVLKILVKEKKPVYIAIPSDIAEWEISDKLVNYEWESDKSVLESLAQKISQKIDDSKKPVILGDVLIKRFDAVIEYKEFVEKAKIPVTNFLMGAGLINSEYELYLGGYYDGLENIQAQNAINNTDCLIAVGAIYSDLNSFGMNLPFKIDNHIAIYGTYSCVDGVKYENVRMNDVLDLVAKKINPKNLKIEKQNLGYQYIAQDETSLSAKYLYPRIQDFLKENDIVITDTGASTFGIASCKLPDNTEFMTQTLWGAIGWATPATMGACLAKPNARVLLITGDGAHQISALEVGNMLRYKLKPIIIVLNNDGYTIERILSDDSNNEFNCVPNMNYSKFARIFGGDVWSTKVNTIDDFDKAIKVTQIMNKMCYIEACFDSMDVPDLTQKLVDNLNSKKNDDEIIEIKSNDDKKEELAIDKMDYDNKSSFSFETVVHKGLLEE